MQKRRNLIAVPKSLAIMHKGVCVYMARQALGNENPKSRLGEKHFNEKPGLHQGEVLHAAITVLSNFHREWPLPVAALEYLNILVRALGLIT